MVDVDVEDVELDVLEVETLVLDVDVEVLEVLVEVVVAVVVEVEVEVEVMYCGSSLTGAVAQLSNEYSIDKNVVPFGAVAGVTKFCSIFTSSATTVGAFCNVGGMREATSVEE